MIAKIRMQVGETVISWGARPELLSISAQAVKRPVRREFAVIEGGRQPAITASDDLQSLHVRSA